jgi:hypothetical protein
MGTIEDLDLIELGLGGGDGVILLVITGDRIDRLLLATETDAGSLLI